MKKYDGHGKSDDGRKEKSSSVKENPEKLTRIFESCILNMSRIYHFLAGSVYHNQPPRIYANGIPLQKPDIYSSGYWNLRVACRSTLKEWQPKYQSTAVDNSVTPPHLHLSKLTTHHNYPPDACNPSPSYKFSSNSLLIDSICSISIYFQLVQHRISSYGSKRWGGKRLTLSTLGLWVPVGLCFFEENPSSLGCWVTSGWCNFSQFRLPLLNL